MTELTPMFDPPHPGESIPELYLVPSGLSAKALARKLGVTASTFPRLLKASLGVSPEMALRLSHVVGKSVESRLGMQHTDDLWKVRKHRDLTT